MRQECKNFESRTYANGEMVRKCNIDLAPDAPWRCPDHCPGYERRLADAGWIYGSLAPPPPPGEPPGLDDGSAAAVLDAAEDILSEVRPSVRAQLAASDDNVRGGDRGWWRRITRRKG